MKTNVTQDAAVRLMLKYPFWSELYYSMTVYSAPDIPTLATDGVNLWVNPEFWATLSLDLKISAVAHEIGHKMLLHSTRRGGRNPTLWNMAADYVVNGILHNNGFKLGDEWLFDAKYLGMSTEAVYNALEDQLIKEKPPRKGQGEGQGEGEGESEGGGPGRGQSVPSSVPKSWAAKWQDIKEVTGAPETIDKYEKAIIEQVQKAVLSAQQHGHSPAGMEAFEGVCLPTSEPWFNHLQRFMQSLSVAEYSWAKMNRRMMVVHNVFAPHHYAESLGEVVVAIDASGSVFDAYHQSNFAGHTQAILSEAKPSKVHVMFFDSAITRYEEMDYGDLTFNTRPKGGGGTDFRPIFDAIEDLGIAPAVVIVLTDCAGDYPTTAPEYPVIWASIEENPGYYKPPFGDFLHVE